MLYLTFFQRGDSFKFLRNFGITLAKPVFESSNFLRDYFSSLGAYFKSKNSLQEEINSERLKIEELKLKLEDYEKIFKQREELLNIFGRLEKPSDYILGGVLSAPPRSPYDILILDAGEKEGIVEGMEVFSSERSIIGKIKDVFPDSSIVKLLSFPGESLDVHFIQSNILAVATGLGGGNFSVKVPSSSKIEEGELIETVGIKSFVLGRVGKITKDSANPFHLVRFRLSENIQDLRFILVRKNH